MEMELTLTELADDYIEIDSVVKEMEDKLKEFKAKREQIMQLLADKMIGEETQSINKKGKTLYLSETVSVTTPAENKELLIEALTENGYADVVKPSVSAQTLTALVKELSGEEDVFIPEWLEGIVTLYRAPKVNIRKSK